ncbi:MAG: GNAT family N-acetyltransferase [Acidobacteriota bacterium]
MTQPTDKRISLRAVTPDDGELLLEVYAAARAIEVAMMPWDDAEKEVFLRQQLGAQTAFYTAEFPTATHDIVLFEGQPAGRIYVERGRDLIKILDIAILPQFRRNGIATVLIMDLTKEARPVRVSVESFNPSQKLFNDLGFAVVANDSVNIVFERTPAEK